MTRTLHAQTRKMPVAFRICEPRIHPAASICDLTFLQKIMREKQQEFLVMELKNKYSRIPPFRHLVNTVNPFHLGETPLHFFL